LGQTEWTMRPGGQKSGVWFVQTRWLGEFERALIGREDRLWRLAADDPFKDNSARTIFAFALPGGERMFCKRYKRTPFLRRVAQMFTGQKAFVEWKTLRNLRKKNIPVPEPVAVFLCKSGAMPSESFLFMLEIPFAVTLKQVLRDACRGGSRAARQKADPYLNNAAELVAQLARARFHHRDLHTGNVLVRNPGSGEEQLYVVDVHRGEFVSPAVGQAALDMAASLLYSISLAADSAAQARFVEHLKLHEFLASRADIEWSRLPALVDQRRTGHISGRLKKSVAGSGEFPVETASGVSIVRARDFPPEAVREALKEHERTVSEGRLLKSGRSRAISVVSAKSGGWRERLLVKEHKYAGVAAGIKNIVRTHPAKRAWMAMNGLYILGLPTPRPLALVEETASGNTGRALLVMEFIEESRASDRFAAEEFGGRDECRADRLAFLREFADAVRNLHDKGVFHSDLKANNVIVRRTNSELNGFEFFFIDLDAVSFERRVGEREVLKNLAQLNAATPADAASRTDRLRFLDRYFSANPLTNEARREIARKVMKLTVERKHFWPAKAAVSPK
jgi:tRNA A-37 threonylcarbamoyl transferase component Bud32